MLMVTALGRLTAELPVEPTSSSSSDERALLRLFADTKHALFSVHQIAQMGVSEGKHITDWFGPNTIAQVLRKLCAFERPPANIGVHVAMDNLLILDDVHRMCRERPAQTDLDGGQATDQHPVLIIIPLRLGLTHLNPVYAAALHVSAYTCLCTPSLYRHSSRYAGVLA
jgi:cysteine protease ATG4